MITSNNKIKPCNSIESTLILHDYSLCSLNDEVKVQDIVKLLANASFIDLMSLKRVTPRPNPVEVVLGSRRDTYLLRTSDYVGFTLANDTSLAIIPRVFKGRKPREGMIGFLRMLGIVLDMELSFKVASTAVNNVGKAGLFEAILYLYARMLEAELLKGAYRRYVRHTGEERFVRGKLLISKQTRKLLSRMHLLSMEYHTFSINNPLNRVLRTAAQLGARVAKNNKTRIMLNDVVALLGDADLTRNIFADIKRVHFNRLNYRFKPLYQLAKIIIYGLEPFKEEKSYSFFIARSEIMFQHLVYRTLEKQSTKLGEDCTIDYEKSREWALIREIYPSRKDYVSQVPDISVKCENFQTYIDLKYKDISDKGVPDENDLRQLYVYARIMEKETRKQPAIVYLLYPYLENSFNAGFFYNNRLAVYRYLQKKKNQEDAEEPYLIVSRYDLGNLLKDGKPYDRYIVELISNSIKCKRSSKYVDCLIKTLGNQAVKERNYSNTTA